MSYQQQIYEAVKECTNQGEDFDYTLYFDPSHERWCVTLDGKKGSRDVQFSPKDIVIMEEPNSSGPLAYLVSPDVEIVNTKDGLIQRVGNKLVPIAYQYVQTIQREKLIEFLEHVRFERQLTLF